MPNEAGKCPSSSNVISEPQATSQSLENPSAKDGNAEDLAKQWTYYVEALKRTVDCLYEICREKQSVVGCKVTF